MIQIYKAGNENFEQNGHMVLMPERADVSVKLNQEWELQLSHPIDPEGRWKYIEDEAVIKLPSFNGEQLFRIKDKVKTEHGIEAIAEPIFMDARDDCFLTDIRPTGKTGQQALDLMTAPNKKYSARSDITRKTTAYYQCKNLIEAINGDDDNSFINRWGGEVLFDNYTVVVNNRVGGDYGVQVLYGKNIQKDGIEEEVDFREVITRIYPKAFNGHSMSGKGYVDSPLVNNYATVKARTMAFEDIKLYEDAQEGDEENGITICKTQAELDKALEQKCKDQFDTGIDKPAVTISVDMVLLQNTVEYRDYKNLETVSLGDTVHCRHSKLGITTDARVIELAYDAIRKKVTAVVIGDFSYDYFNNVSSTVNRSEIAIRPDGTVIGQQIQGIINMALSQLKLQNTVAKRVNVLAILFEDLDPESDLFGAMGIGTQGFAIANERTEDGRDWKWKTFGTANGFWADLIVAGTMLYDRCRGGTAELGGLNNTSGVLRILDAAAKEIGKWDKDGILVKTGEINGPTVVVGGSADGILKILNASGKEIGRWDKNGIKATKGSINGPKITVGGSASGELVILDNSGKEIGRWDKNGITITRGRIEDGTGRSYWNLTTGEIQVSGRIIQYHDSKDLLSLIIERGYARFYSFNRKDRLVGALSTAVGYDTGSEFLELYHEEDCKLRLGYIQKTNEDGSHDIKPYVTFDITQEKPIQLHYMPKIPYTLSGRAEFSDGTYLEFDNGLLVGGNAKAGGF